MTTYIRERMFNLYESKLIENMLYVSATTDESKPSRDS